MCSQTALWVVSLKLQTQAFTVLDFQKHYRWIYRYWKSAQNSLEVRRPSATDLGSAGVFLSAATQLTRLWSWQTIFLSAPHNAKFLLFPPTSIFISFRQLPLKKILTNQWSIRGQTSSIAKGEILQVLLKKIYMSWRISTNTAGTGNISTTDENGFFLGVKENITKS